MGRRTRDDARQDTAVAGHRAARRRHSEALRQGRCRLPFGGNAKPRCTGRMTAASSDLFDAAGRQPIRVGISTCLLGDKVRFDGGHKRNAFLTETFGRIVEWVPVCPEVEYGLGTPAAILPASLVTSSRRPIRHGGR